MAAALALVAASCLTVSGSGDATAQSVDPYELPDPAASVGGMTDPGGHPAGTDLPTCTPGPEHPRPVVLVHGVTSNAQENWSHAAPYLVDQGFCVYTVTYGALGDGPVLGGIGGLTPMMQSIPQLAAAVDRAKAATGSDTVDIVAHSMGTALTAGYLKLADGAGNVDTVVDVAGVMGGMHILDGLGAAITGLSGSGDHSLFGPADLLADSDYISRINTGGSPLAEGVRYVNIVSATDGTITPYTSGLAEGPNATNVVIQDGCPGDTTKHSGLVKTPRALALIHNGLSPQHPVPVPCEA